MSAGKPAPLVIHGWTIFAHPLFLAQLEALAQQVESLKKKDPVGYVKKNASKRLAAITKLAFDVIPQDPTRPEYRQGNTLGEDHKHWFRAKFFQQYRLFFRYHAPSKVIVFAWVNDEDTKRAYESSDDAYRVFRKMLESGHPPDDWNQLLPPNGYYEVSAAKDKIVRMHDSQIKDEERAKSFHLDTYCFDSGSENWLFWDLLREQRVKKIYFTGMLTHGQSDFFIQYIDPDSRTVRSYYPDFIFQREEPDGSLKYVIVEVKADNQIEDAVVQAKKDFAQQIAVASGMEYRILKSSDADKRHFRVLL